MGVGTGTENGDGIGPGPMETEQEPHKRRWWDRESAYGKKWQTGLSQRPSTRSRNRQTRGRGSRQRRSQSCSRRCQRKARTFRRMLRQTITSGLNFLESGHHLKSILQWVSRCRLHEGFTDVTFWGGANSVDKSTGYFTIFYAAEYNNWSNMQKLFASWTEIYLR